MVFSMWEAKSSLVRVGSMEGAMILPVATSKLAIKHRVAWRMYSCSWHSTLPGRIGRAGWRRSRAWMPVRLLVGADQMNALLVQGERFGVMLANSPNLRVEDLRFG